MSLEELVHVVEPDRWVIVIWGRLKTRDLTSRYH